MRKRSIPSTDEEIDALRSERDKLLQEIRQLQMEHDILKKADEIIKKGPGISTSALTNREKTKVADALREAYPLPALLSILQLARSSYFTTVPRCVPVINMRVYVLLWQRSSTATTAVMAIVVCTQCSVMKVSGSQKKWCAG